MRQTEVAPGALVNAVIVPASRPVESLDTAMKVAHELACVLVVMCSRSVLSDQVVTRASDWGVSVVAIDVDAVGDDLPDFDTNQVVLGSRFKRSTDTSRKRNLALLFSRLVGWQRVLLLDDDIRQVRASDVWAAAGLLNYYDAVGLQNRGFPDNSVVCHVNREVGFMQDQFIGAGALVVAPARAASFFPDIYNEDWFFLMGDQCPPRVAVTGAVYQDSFDPFADPDRARDEEFGDCLAEGLFWLLDEGKPLERADRSHWRDFLKRRRRFIDVLRGRLDCRSQRSVRMVASLEAAREICVALGSELCDGYVHLWRSDLVRWRQFVAGKPERLGLEKALVEVGWYGIARLHSEHSHEEAPLLCVDE